MQLLGYFLLRLVTESFRLVPFRLLYGISDVFAFVLHRVIGYRKGVIHDNLRRAFPEMPDAEINAIINGAYRNLTDVTLETLKEISMSPAEIRRRMFCRNPELVNAYLESGRSVILTGSHLNNWEWSGLSMPLYLHGTVITAYKPMSNKYTEAYSKRHRSRTGMVMTSMDDTFAAMRRNRAQPSVYLLLSDQSPSSRKSAHWLPFFGINTAFAPGIDLLARRFNLPVAEYHLRRLKRGYYEVWFSEICADPEAAPPQAITKAYAAQLEELIREQPANWLWSHRRWKLKPPAEVEQ